MNDLHGSRFLIIGASSGIGKALASSLRDSGAEVHTASRTTPEDMETPEHHQQCDVTSDDVEIEVPDALDGLVYCPGSITLAQFNKISDETFIKDFQINVMGAVRCIRHALPALQKGKGSVLLFSTVAVSRGMSFHASIASAKGALEGLTRALAAEFAPRSVRVNAVAPSIVDTPLASGILSNDKRREASEKRHPLSRVGSTDDIVAAAKYLLAPSASWVTGQILHVDGGLSVI